VEPYDNSDPISAYRVLIKTTDGDFLESLPECDGSDLPLSLTCSVAMVTLRADPFDMVYNQLVQARVQATNTNDWGDLSEANIEGARIQTEPV